eukprot:TRINITY_DN38133_c0_g1_i1.p2 TRINITY_DN38133_c0_g1~~TRINITY_DN38133_c0_g1_i1.p2  ORF type:complete len:161 (-),score=26.87 TRINITY_DN38133_c0_g1_i1:244-726(-)
MAFLEADSHVMSSSVEQAAARLRAPRSAEYVEEGFYPEAADDAEEGCGEDDDRILPRNPFAVCGMCVICTVLTLYFIPMLILIPQMIHSGPHLPSIYTPQYNNQGVVRVRPEDGAPTGPWFWDIRICFFLVPAVPTVVLSVAYKIKMRQLANGAGAPHEL